MKTRMSCKELVRAIRDAGAELRKQGHGSVAIAIGVIAGSVSFILTDWLKK